MLWQLLPQKVWTDHRRTNYKQYGIVHSLETKDAEGTVPKSSWCKKKKKKEKKSTHKSVSLPKSCLLDLIHKTAMKQPPSPFDFFSNTVLFDISLVFTFQTSTFEKILQWANGMACNHCRFHFCSGMVYQVAGKGLQCLFLPEAHWWHQSLKKEHTPVFCHTEYAMDHRNLSWRKQLVPYSLKVLVPGIEVHFL